MTDNELLLAISNLLDKKLSSELQPIKRKIDSLENRFDSLENRFISLENRFDSLENRFDSLENRFDSLENRFYALEGEVQSLRTDSVAIRHDINALEDKLHHANLVMENIVLPRLGTIESCYTDTFHRYQDYAEKIESALSDTDLLKRVVSEHSEKLQKIS